MTNWLASNWQWVVTWVGVALILRRLGGIALELRRQTDLVARTEQIARGLLEFEVLNWNVNVQPRMSFARPSDETSRLVDELRMERRELERHEEERRRNQSSSD